MRKERKISGNFLYFITIYLFLCRNNSKRNFYQQNNIQLKTQVPDNLSRYRGYTERRNNINKICASKQNKLYRNSFSNEVLTKKYILKINNE